ncbi:MAG: DUF58 domain-containing protein [Halobacteriota archaeon]
MRLTRRGKAVVLVCIAGVALAGIAGARSLNAIVVPGIVVLLAGYLQLRAVPTPQPHRRGPPNGFVDETHTVELRFTEPNGGSIDRPFVATMTEQVTNGLRVEPPSGTIAVGAGPVGYDVTFTDRGEQTIGPLRLLVRDVFGVLETDRVCRRVDSCLVYPERHRIAAAFRRTASGGDSVDVSRKREAFDRLREYTRGDSLRDVHWPTTAKRDRLVVKTFAADTDRDDVTISGGASVGNADELATAVTSVALDVHESGRPVAVSIPNGRVPVEPSGEGLSTLLETLATVGSGAVPDPKADVVIESDADRTTVTVDEHSVRFDDLTVRSASARGRDGRSIHTAIGQLTNRPGPNESSADRRGASEGTA